MRPILITSQQATEGAGVRIRRGIGTSTLRNLDPFLMLDYFDTDRADDYLAGFPPHPHRGFVTLTYMVDGRMEHQDSMGHKGVIGPGDAQWMKAARGVIHSEMPKQIEGRMAGFQLWINLPDALKLSDPEYREVTANDIPVVHRDGARLKIVVGSLDDTVGAIRDAVTGVDYYEVELEAGASFDWDLKRDRSGFAFVFEGHVTHEDLTARRGDMVAGEGTTLRLSAGDAGARFIAVRGHPIKEPIVQAGPFVMTNERDIRRAIVDYQSGRLTA